MEEENLFRVPPRPWIPVGESNYSISLKVCLVRDKERGKKIPEFRRPFLGWPPSLYDNALTVSAQIESKCRRKEFFQKYYLIKLEM